MIDRIRTISPQELTAVTSCLQATGGAWTASPPDYAQFSHVDMSKKLEQVRDAVLGETDAANTEVEEAYQRTQYFIDSSFEFYEGRKDLGRQIQRAFLVPVRSTRDDPSDSGEGSGYASESIPFFPLLDPQRFGISSEIRMRTIYGLPPTVLDTYLRSSDQRETGAVVLAPLYTDMVRDICTNPADAKQSMQLTQTVNHILAETAAFAHRRLGARFVGLGATLPLLTDFGNKLKQPSSMSELVTTTGHGGTVYMLAKTATEVMHRSSVDSHGTIGVVGAAGSIGWSSVHALREMLPGHKIEVFDKRADAMRALLAANQDLGELQLRDSIVDIFKHNNYVVFAITEKVDLAAPEFEAIDFSAVRVIDDSQPGAVDRAQIERLGGQVFWVAGRDRSASRFMTRDGYYTDGVPYNYGESSGLYGHSTEFACGLEAATIAARGDEHNAINRRVNYSDVKVVGNLFDEYCVEVADFQSFGKPVDIR